VTRSLSRPVPMDRLSYPGAASSAEHERTTDKRRRFPLIKIGLNAADDLDVDASTGLALGADVVQTNVALDGP
jgi:hypothetical protein